MFSLPAFSTISMKHLSISFLVAITLANFGCQAPKSMTADADGASVPVIGETLATGDTLKIGFSGAAELNQTLKIRPDGKISLPKVGEVKAAGKKAIDFQSQLSALYRPILQNAEISVIVENSSFPVTVLGAVNQPGEVNLDRPSLLQAIGKALGVTRGLGDATRVRIIHEGENGTKVRVVNLDAILKGKSKDVIYLQRGDTVYVPEKFL